MLIKSTKLTDEWAEDVFRICEEDGAVISMETCKEIALHFGKMMIYREGTIIAGFGGNGDDYAKIYQQ